MMRSRFGKCISSLVRAVIGLLTLAALTLLFVGAAPAWFGLSTIITWPQFIPSFLRTVAGGLTVASAGFLLVALLTLGFGRLYCGALCPLGAWMDFSRRVSRRIARKPAKFHKPVPALRYVFLAVAVAALLTGNAALFALIDPYSIWGRIAADMGKPLVSGIGALLETPVHAAGFPEFQRLTWHFLPWMVFAVSLALLVIVTGFAILSGRLWCNTVCPVGTLLGLFARLSPFRFRFRSTCTACGACSRVCRAECIDVKSRKVDASRCVSCFDCVSKCPSGDMAYGLPLPAPVPLADAPSNPSRRTFLKSAVIGAAALAVTALPSKASALFVSSTRACIVTPPGAQGLANYRRNCTACHLCVSACPDRILTPAFLENGISGFMQPRMDFTAGYCSYECVECSRVCPTGAIRPLTPAAKKGVQIGAAVFSLPPCIVSKDRTHCGACSEVCPTKACTMAPWEDGLEIPLVRESICVGCGACEYACPARPKAIVVHGHDVHRKAMPPESVTAKERVTESVGKKADEGFGF